MFDVKWLMSSFFREITLFVFSNIERSQNNIWFEKNSLVLRMHYKWTMETLV